MDDFLIRAFGDQAVVAIVVTAVLLLLAEAGYRVGREGDHTLDEARRSQSGVVQGAVLGLMGLLLGFTFSMAMARSDTRGGLVVKEANAIGTTWLRAGLLPDAHRQVVRHLVRDYLDVRIRGRAGARDPAVLAEGLRESAAIQSQLWQRAEAAAIEAPNDMTAAFVEALNEMIDTGTERAGAARSGIPAGVWLIVLIVSAVACYASAYSAGSYGFRSPSTSVVLPLLISVVMLLTFDLTNERWGIMGVSQQPLLDLQISLRSESPVGQPPDPPR